MGAHAWCVADVANTLGEGCVWDPRDARLIWTDIESACIWRLGVDGAQTSVRLPDRAGFILPRAKAGFIVGFADGIAIADASLTRFERITAVEEHLPQTRLNDAAVDPFGGVVFGTFDERDRRPVASLYRLGIDGSLSTLIEGGITISNGIAFSPDGRLLYFADTADGTIRRFEIGGEFERLDELTPLAGPDIAPGRPDGAIVDADGGYWSARVWGGCVVRLSPKGELTQTVKLPTVGPTCVALGGPTLTRLFVTTLRVRQTEEELAKAPLAGGLFAADVTVPGVPQRLTRL